MSKISINASWIPNGSKFLCDINYESDVEIYIDHGPHDPTPYGKFRIIALMEPFDYLKERMLQYLEEYQHCYDYIFTYHDDILKQYPNSLLSVTPTTWISHPYEFRDKEFSISGIFGNKHNSQYLPLLDGYIVRWNVFNSKHKILPEKKFYLSTHSPIDDIEYKDKLVLGESKNPLFDSQFHLAIENTNLIRNAFSEKIIDCFQTKTIPIYYGPENIGDFFNIDGILYAKSQEEIIEICNSITPETYFSMTSAIEDNYIRSMKYKSLESSMIEKTKKILKIN